MPEARHGACMVSTGCSIFVLGGRAGPGDHGRPLTTMFRLEKADLFSDFQTGVWKQCASMKHSRSSFGCLAFKGVVFAVGGLTGIKVVDSVELYDPSQNSWTAGPRLNHARAHLNISVYQDRFIQAIGGQDADGKSVTTAEIWDLEMVEPCWKVVDFPLCFSGDKPCFVSVGVWWPMDGEFSYDIERSEEQLSPREIWNIEARKTIEYNPYREQEMKGTLPMLSFDRGMSPSSSPRNATIKSPQSLRRSNDESFRLTQGANEENVTPADEVEFAESCFSPLPYKPVDISSGFRTPEEVRQHKMFDFMTPISAVRIPEMPGDISPDPLTTSLPSDPSILLAANKAFMLAQAPFVDHESASVASCQSSETPILYPDSTPRGMHGGTFSFERGNFVGAEQRLFASSDSSSDGLSPVMLTDGQSSTDNMFPSRSSLSGYALTLDDRTKLLLRDMLDGIDDPSPEVVHALQCLNATSKSSSSRGPALFAYAKPCCGKLCVFSDKKALRKSWDLDQVVRAKPMKADPMQWLSEG
ncbi:MAG: uncharacterized protein KVP18_003125 [Porospora cf. gigantea A]|uniref:uncharacterized protein n=2 Tax=Porospora cf. gigantea A TaxID=2853593 RepID=UPI00355ABCBC|nr:MAG: hypothetical protein KVP18_003125 [Porospora cf. gigantea A]